MSFVCYLGECEKVMRDLSPVDVIVTDPPYGVNKAAWDGEFPVNWIEPAWAITKRMLVMTGNLYMLDFGKAIGQYKDFAILHARNGMTRSKVSFGNFIPVLIHGEWKWEARPNYLPFNVSTVESIPHPSPKPLEAMRLLISRYTSEGETVLDPFMGSGTIGVACVQLGRNYIGIEREKEYFEFAQQRISQAQHSSFTLPNNRLHMDAGDSPRLPSQSTLEGFTPAEQGTTPAPRQ